MTSPFQGMFVVICEPERLSQFLPSLDVVTLPWWYVWNIKNILGKEKYCPLQGIYESPSFIGCHSSIAHSLFFIDCSLFSSSTLKLIQPVTILLMRVTSAHIYCSSGKGETMPRKILKFLSFCKNYWSNSFQNPVGSSMLWGRHENLCYPAVLSLYTYFFFFFFAGKD